MLVIFAATFIEKRGVDDPVGAIAVHGVCGSFGVLAVGIFANGSYGGGWNGSDVTAVEGVVAGQWGQLGAQALGVLVIWTVIFGIAFAFFKIQNKLTKGGIRSAELDEIAGLDLPEMGALAYPEFEMAIEQADPEVGHRPLVGSAGAACTRTPSGSHPSVCSGRARPTRARPERVRRPSEPLARS